MFSFKILKDLNLIISYYSDEFSLRCIKECTRRLVIDPSYSVHYDTITDLRNANLKIDAQDVRKYIDYIKNDLNIVVKKKLVYLTNKPHEVVLTTILSQKMKNFEYDVFVCSTEESAIAYLSKTSLKNGKLNELINEIKYTIPDNLNL